MVTGAGTGATGGAVFGAGVAVAAGMGAARSGGFWGGVASGGPGGGSSAGENGEASDAAEDAANSDASRPRLRGSLAGCGWGGTGGPATWESGCAGANAPGRRSGIPSGRRGSSDTGGGGTGSLGCAAGGRDPARRSARAHGARRLFWRIGFGGSGRSSGAPRVRSTVDVVGGPSGGVLTDSSQGSGPAQMAGPAG